MNDGVTEIRAPLLAFPGSTGARSTRTSCGDGSLFRAEAPELQHVDAGDRAGTGHAL